jgi:c-di-GMP-binding flagellar brake protein YcgR
MQRSQSDHVQVIDHDRGRIIAEETSAGLAIDLPQARSQLRQPVITQPLPGYIAHHQRRNRHCFRSKHDGQRRSATHPDSAKSIKQRHL